MKSAIESFAELVEKQGWEYSLASDSPVIHTGFTGEIGRLICVAVNRVAFVEVSPDPARHVVFSNLCTINWLFRAIMQVLVADVLPKSAMKLVAMKKPLTLRFELNCSR